MRHLAAALLMFFALPCMAKTASQEPNDNCGARTLSGGTVFTLTVERSFQPGLAFLLCQRKAPNQSFLLIQSELKSASTNKKIMLNDKDFVELMGLYENALTYNARDHIIGLDGSIWCLETKRGLNYSKACFYTPGYDTGARGLTGLNLLGVALWKIGSMSTAAGKLY